MLLVRLVVINTVLMITSGYRIRHVVPTTE
jgi:hypothetical protein